MNNPALTQDVFQDAARLTGYDDKATIETEPFFQWIVEGNFPSGSPKRKAGGASLFDENHAYKKPSVNLNAS